MRDMFHFQIRQKFCIRMIAICVDSKMYMRVIGIFIKTVINLVIPAEYKSNLIRKFHKEVIRMMIIFWTECKNKMPEITRGFKF